MKINQGILHSARWVASPNFGARPAGSAISLLVIHNISLPPGEFGGKNIEDFFCNQLDPSKHPYFASIADLQVSSHLLIKRTGEVVQFVNLNDRAWHAGVSSFDGVENCNDYSIGIELEGTDQIPYTDQQYAALQQVTLAIQAEYPLIEQQRITGHEQIAPGRKTDPGPAFDWEQYLKTL